MEKEQIVKIIQDFVLKDSGNNLPGKKMPIFDSPLIGFAEADDPLFDKLQLSGVVKPSHIKPTGWLPDAKTVISYALPAYSEISKSNYDGPSASEEWLYHRWNGEIFNDRLRYLIISALRAAGYNSIAPLISPHYEAHDLVSNWSERHVAYIAGLGTFGLHKGLITEKGVSVRFGSVVTNLQLAPKKRIYSGIYDYCPWFNDKKCGACIKRCPVGAISPEGKNIPICNVYLKDEDGEVVRTRYGFPYSSCGKCYVNIPCESRIPM